MHAMLQNQLSKLRCYKMNNQKWNAQSTCQPDKVQNVANVNGTLPPKKKRYLSNLRSAATAEETVSKF
jgi:hypothetical protein